MKRIISVVLVLGLVLVSLTGCGTGSTDAGSVKIAIAGPMTGDFAEYGTGFRNAVELMVNEWNENGGVLGQQIELMIYDDKNDGEEAATIAERIASDNQIMGVVGHFASGVCMAATPTYQETGIVNISPSASHPDFTKEGDFIFRNNTVINVEAEAAVAIATELYGKKKVGILSARTDWGASTAEITKELVKAAGAEVVDHQEILDGTVDFSPNISRLHNAGAEVIIVAAMYNVLGPFASQYQDVNPDIQFVGFSNAYSRQLIELAGDSAEGIHFPTQFFDGSTEENVVAFVNAYQEAYGSTPSSLTAQAYDSAGIILTAIQNAGKTDRTAIRDQVAGIEYEGVTGFTTFNEFRDSVRPFTVVKIHQGEFVEVK